ncbi:odorant receptor 131-2-like [Conger conger]|uniref:odorant receptor 131-2-like n=1 Tax=Conger conger TaxID=82655 RepID=UPI002A5A4B8A|nr:odorant receptor 131-2-like [Conger conger]
MENASTISSNAQEYLSDSHLLRFGFSLIPVVFFTYLNCVMLFTLKRKAAFQGVPRYILFGHMLLADSLQFLCSMISYLIAVVKVYMTNGLCGVFLSLANITNHISPLNLAVMALERYSAICFPLRHAEIATSKWTGVAIGVVWVLGSLNPVTQFFMYLAIGPPFAVVQVYCGQRTFSLKLFTNMNKVFTAVYFVLVGFIIIYTYIAIMVEAKSASSDKSKAAKARNTVLLHLIQLGLCLSSLSVTPLSALASRLETHASDNVR